MDYSMIRKIPFKLSVNAMLVLLGCVLVFHILVLAGLVSFEMVWGGRLQDAQQMRAFEIVSITANLLILGTVAMRGDYVSRVLPAKVVTVLLWIFFAIFSLNTVGNIFAQSKTEALVMTPLTLLSAILCWRMAVEH